MKITVEIPNEVLAKTIQDLILEKGILQQAVARCFSEGRITEKISELLEAQMTSLLASVVDGKTVVEALRLAVSDAIGEAIAKTMEMVGQERIAEMARLQLKG